MDKRIDIETKRIDIEQGRRERERLGEMEGEIEREGDGVRLKEIQGEIG